FFTGRPIPDGRRGMGLGLAICKSIAEAHGGSISVSNTPGGGARFEVRLPVESGMDDGSRLTGTLTGGIPCSGCDYPGPWSP
ncbi:MAG: hypothetical protein KAU31_13295, partial [Spirochaetaceae bacterium]|nr:hypothetical protein [Spirochaetaceae bacterium]